MKRPRESLIKPGAAISNYGRLDRRRRGQSEVAPWPEAPVPSIRLSLPFAGQRYHKSSFSLYRARGSPGDQTGPDRPTSSRVYTAESAQRGSKGAESSPRRGEIDDRTNGRGVIFIPPEDPDSLAVSDARETH